MLCRALDLHLPLHLPLRLLLLQRLQQPVWPRRLCLALRNKLHLRLQFHQQVVTVSAQALPLGLESA